MHTIVFVAKCFAIADHTVGDNLHSIIRALLISMVTCISFDVMRIKLRLPLLLPCESLRMVHSSIVPNLSNNSFTSVSDCCLLSIPTKSFLSSKVKLQPIIH